MKENPLFVDSTKTRGDNIKAIFELSQILLRDEEQLIVKIIEEPQERQHEVLLRSEEEGLFKARVYLQHQNQIRFQFVIIAPEKVVFTSPIYEDRANYLIEKVWEPAPDIDLLFDKKKETMEAREHKVYEQFQENKTLLGNLIKQWGL